MTDAAVRLRQPMMTTAGFVDAGGVAVLDAAEAALLIAGGRAEALGGGGRALVGAYIGDSYAARGLSATVDGWNAIAGLVQFRSHGRYRYRWSHVLATSGTWVKDGPGQPDHLSQMASALRLSPRPDFIVWTTPGTNDAVGGKSAARLKAEIAQGVALARQAGVPLILTPIPPRASGAETAAIAAVLMEVYRWLRETVWRLPGVRGADVVPAMLDAASATFAPVAGMHDALGLHPKHAGADAIAAAIVSSLDVQFPGASFLPPVSAADVWDAASNAYGNLLPNPILSGTSGTKSTAGGTAPTGSVPTSLTAQTRLAGVTVDCSVVSDPTFAGAQMLEMDLGGSVTGQTAGCLWVWQDATASGGNFAAGDTLEAMARIEFVAAANILAVQTQLFDNHGGSFVANTMTGDRLLGSDSAYYPLVSPLTQTGLAITPPLKLTAGMTGARLRHTIWAVEGQTLSGKLRIGRMRIQRAAE